MIWLIVWVVLMLFWLCFGCYSTYDPARPHALGGTIIPWVCVLILGIFVFGGITPVVTSQPAVVR